MTMSRLQPSLNLRRQFVIAAPRTELSPDLETRKTLGNGLLLSAHPALELASVLDAQGEQIGYLLGVGISAIDAKRHRDTISLKKSISTYQDIDAFVENEVYTLSGTFIFVLDIIGVQRAYLDACGSLSAVYDPERNIFASTATAFLDLADYKKRFRQDLYSHLRILGEGWFPAGLTAHVGVERLLVNHYLDLNSWQTRRHWPTGSIKPVADPVEACREIGAIARGVIDACIADGSTVIALTGGNETRLLLSVLKDCATSLPFATVESAKTLRDVVITKKLVDRFGLQQILLPVVQADDDGAWDWHSRAGHCVGDVNMRTYPSIAPLSEYNYFIGGLGGEIGRGFFWKNDDKSKDSVSISRLVGALGMPPHKDVRTAIEKWYKTVPDMDIFTTLDIAYIELRMGCWGFPQCYSANYAEELHPLIGRRTFTLMMSLPPQWRQEQRFITETIRLYWPELLEYQINKYGDYRDYTEPARRALRNPRGILKKLRRVMAR